MSKPLQVVSVARTRTRGGREHGISRSFDGCLDVRLALPGSGRIGTTPEQLFAAAWSACFETGIFNAARRARIKLPAAFAIDAEITLATCDESHELSARFIVSIPGMARDLAFQLIDEGHQSCPYAVATRGNITVTVELAE